MRHDDRQVHQSTPKMAFGLGLPLTIETWAKLMAIIAVAPTTEPDDRSMPPVMMTCVTPMAMMPTIDTCRMMIDRRASLKMASTFWTGVEQEANRRSRAAHELEAGSEHDEGEKHVEFRRPAAACACRMRRRRRRCVKCQPQGAASSARVENGRRQST